MTAGPILKGLLMTEFLPIKKINIRITQREEIFCDNPACNHNSPVQTSIAAEFNKHFVQIVKDGERFHVRVNANENTAHYNLTLEELENFLMTTCELKGD